MTVLHRRLRLRSKGILLEVHLVSWFRRNGYARSYIHDGTLEELLLLCIVWILDNDLSVLYLRHLRRVQRARHCVLYVITSTKSLVIALLLPNLGLFGLLALLFSIGLDCLLVAYLNIGVVGVGDWFQIDLDLRLLILFQL